jgi:SAM-dependent methyltransferase/uncharacterized protein YbaR (Trm112 family)
MLESIVQHLVCPETASSLRLEVKQREDDHVMEGELISVSDETCRYPITNGVPRFVQKELLPDKQREVVNTFSFKWEKIPNYASDPYSKQYREEWYYERFGFKNGDNSVREFIGDAQFLLEAGTATGVDTDMLARNSHGLVFGIDISTAIDIAFKRFRDNPRVALLQADIGRLPFRPEFFDVISCDQVLHHTPNPPENFGRLARLLRHGGRLLLYVYKVKGPIREFSDDYLRAIYTESSVEACLDFSHRLAHLGRNLSHLHVQVDVDEDIPELGITRGRYDVQRLIYDHMLKCYWNDSFDEETNTMVNFDWYRPLHAYRYTPEQVVAWGKDNALQIRHFDVSPSGISTIMERRS